MTWLWEVLQLLGFSTTVRLMMYNVWGGDVQQLNERCMTFTLCYYYPVICIQLFQFRPQAPCQKGIAAEGTVLQLHSWSFMKGVRCFSPFSPQKQFRTWYRSRYQMVPLSVSESTIPQVSQYHSASQPAPFKELEISPYFIHSYTGFPLITIRLTVYNE
mgnify:CR=1 FL=1